MPAWHHGNLRVTLLGAARRSLRENGVEQLPLRELAREAGASHAAPRRYFADRRALLDALAEADFVRLGAELHTARDAAGAAFGSRLHELAVAYLRFATEHAALLEVMFAGKHRAGAEWIAENRGRPVRTAARSAPAGPGEGCWSPATYSGSVSSSLSRCRDSRPGERQPGGIELLDGSVEAAVDQILRGSRCP
ncbi:TetR/AcrR family transcriptional regulator [Streptomyces sp. JH002]|uniref:TetR/AcrR family transcriptional regulator n=1 Tax=Streptomyces sp. JH002 TaxID=2763259 RepID=UPI003D80377E